jgi:acetyl esterase
MVIEPAHSATPRDLIFRRGTERVRTTWTKIYPLASDAIFLRRTRLAGRHDRDRANDIRSAPEFDDHLPAVEGRKDDTAHTGAATAMLSAIELTAAAGKQPAERIRRYPERPRSNTTPQSPGRSPASCYGPRRRPQSLPLNTVTHTKTSIDLKAENRNLQRLIRAQPAGPLILRHHAISSNNSRSRLRDIRRQVITTTSLQDPGRQPFIDPGTQLFIDAISNEHPVQDLSADQARAALTQLQSTPVGRPGADIQDHVLPIGPSGSLPVRIIRPRGATDPLPAIMYFHGGGWVRGDTDTHDRLEREIAVGAHACVIHVAYDLAPEAQYPIAIEQAYAATEYVSAHAGTFGVDPTRLAVAGDDAGGTIAAAVTLMARDRLGPKIDLQILFCPIMGHDFATKSYATFADGPWLTRAAAEWYWNAYLPDVNRRTEITASPALATVDQLRNLPDALIVVAENDPVRDEGEAYARNLADAGVRVTSLRYNGTVHDFVVLNALADTPAAASAVAQAVHALQSAFG